MKRIIFLVLLFQTLCGFARNGFVIRGSVEGLTTGEIYLISDLNHKDTLASAPVLKGEFRLKGISHSRQAALLRIRGVVNGPVLFLENAVYSARLKVTPAYVPDHSGNFTEVKELENELHSVITGGGQDQKTANAFWEILLPVSREYEKISKQYTEAEHQGNESLLESLEAQAEVLRQKTMETTATLIARHNGSYVSAYIIQEYISDLCEEQPEELKKIYALLGEEASRSAYGHPSGIHKQSLQKNDILPSFSLVTPEGSAISLDNIKGKIKILEFWSESCSPCLQEIPQLFKLYEKYKPSGLEIAAISLDSDRQTTERLKQKYRLTWIQAGNYRGNDTDVRKLYGIYSIPYKIVLTEDNRIIDKGNLSLRQIQKLLDTFLINGTATNTPEK